MHKLKGQAILSLVLVIALIGIIALLAYYWSYFSFLSVLVTDALWASVLLTVVLVIVNISSTIQTRETLHEMKEARKAEFMPNVRAKLVWIGATQVALKLKNYGVGPALNLKAEIFFLPSDIKRSWTADIFSPNQSFKLWLPNGGDTRKMSNSIIQITVKGEYSDIFGQKFQLNENIDTKKVIDEVTQLQILDDERAYQQDD